MVGLGVKPGTLAWLDRWSPNDERTRAKTIAFGKKMLAGFLVEDYMNKNNDWISRDLGSLKRGLAEADLKRRIDDKKVLSVSMCTFP